MAHTEVETVEFSRRDHQVPWEDGARVEMKDVRPRGQVRFLCSPENTQVLTAVFLGRIISKARKCVRFRGSCPLAGGACVHVQSHHQICPAGWKKGQRKTPRNWKHQGTLQSSRTHCFKESHVSFAFLTMPLDTVKIMNLGFKIIFLGLRDGSTVRSVYWSYRGLKFCPSTHIIVPQTS